MEKFCWGNAVGYKGETKTDIYTQTYSTSEVWWVSGCHGIINREKPLRVCFNKQIHLQNNQAEDAAKTFGYTVKYRIFEETFLPDIFWLLSDTVDHIFFLLIDIIHTEYIQIFSGTKIHRKHRNHKIQKHAFRWSLWHCSSQHYRHSSPFETALCDVFLSTAETLQTFTTTGIVTHLHLPTKCWLCKAWVRNDRWQWERFITALSSEPVGCYN